MAVDLGLKFDLSQLRSGVKSAAALVRGGMVSSLKPFDTALGKTKRSLQGFGKSIFSVKGFIGGLVTAAAVKRMADFAIGAVKLAHALADARDSLRNVIKATGSRLNFDDANRQAETISMATGSSRGDVMQSQTDLVGRGFGAAQTKEIMALAASVSTRTGKSIQESTKLIADGLSGKVMAAKRIGVQVAQSGDKVKDAEEFARQMRAIYGGLGSQLTNPFDRLSATLTRMKENIGEAIGPALDSVATTISDILNGMGSEELGARLRNIVDGVLEFGGKLDWLYQIFHAVVAMLGEFASFVIQTFTEGIPASFKLLIGEILGAVDGAIRSISETAADKLGVGEMAKNWSGAGRDGLSVYATAQDGMEKSMGNVGAAWRGENNAANQLEEYRAKGAKMRTDAQAEMAATVGTGGNLVNTRVSGVEDGKAMAKARKELAKRGNANAGAGQQVRVSIVSARPDRFRRMRTA
jgi:hypothetical protein